MTRYLLVQQLYSAFSTSVSLPSLPFLVLKCFRLLRHAIFIAPLGVDVGALPTAKFLINNSAKEK